MLCINDYLFIMQRDNKKVMLEVPSYNGVNRLVPLRVDLVFALVTAG